MFIRFVLVILFSSSYVIAQEKPEQPSFEEGSCKSYIQSQCPTAKGPREIFMCLKSNEDKLSTECKQEIERRIQVNRQAARRSGGSLGGFGGMSAIGPPVRMISYEGRYQKDAALMNQQKLNISVPVGKIADGLVGVSLSGSTLHIGDNVRLESGTVLPSELYRAEIGSQYFKMSADRTSWGMRASIGFTGDEVFKSSKDGSFSGNIYYSQAPSADGFWIFTVFIANNSPLGNYIPIPGAIYFYKTPTFTGLFGFPIVSMQWTPVNPWSFGVSIFGPTISTEANYGSIDDMQIFVNAGWSQQSFILKDRIIEKDRLTIEEKKVGFGIRTPVLGFIGAEFQVAKSFERRAYIGEGLFKKAGGSANFDSDWLASVGLRAVF